MHMLEFRILRAMQPIVTLAAILALGPSMMIAQPSPRQFNPGAWEIDSVTTATGGRTVSSQTTLCANDQIDFWKVAQAGLTCKPPKTHPEGNGALRVLVHCEYNGEHLHSEIRSNALETFSDHGNTFTLAGTTTTDTVYQGVQPKKTSVQLQATAHRTGPCQ
ncbi:MAG TPA: hypothetical protein VND66_07820 [Acidobacteriaceae bacterium]|nr:hypothetical protein [Terriglobia bacterium]HVC90513.1 hypothetical protein [Acidobacteriaceae bacterium]